MGEAEFDRDVPFDALAGAVLCRTERGNLHAGVIYGKGREKGFLHLAWEDRLSPTWTWPVFWAAPDALPERLRLVGGLCRRIWSLFQKTKCFPYGLEFDATFENDGRLRLGGEARGLSCATFILAVFAWAGLELIDEEGWPIRKDADEAFLREVEALADPQHVESLRAEVARGCRRFRPEEVMGALACKSPANFAAVEVAASRAVERLVAGPRSM